MLGTTLFIMEIAEIFLGTTIFDDELTAKA